MAKDNDDSEGKGKNKCLESKPLDGSETRTDLYETAEDIKEEEDKLDKQKKEEAEEVADVEYWKKKTSEFLKNYGEKKLAPPTSIFFGGCMLDDINDKIDDGGRKMVATRNLIENGLIILDAHLNKYIIETIKTNKSCRASDNLSLRLIMRGVNSIISQGSNPKRYTVVIHEWASGIAGGLSRTFQVTYADILRMSIIESLLGDKTVSIYNKESYKREKEQFFRYITDRKELLTNFLNVLQGDTND